jgi:type IV pilus assembly protein PilB
MDSAAVQAGGNVESAKDKFEEIKERAKKLRVDFVDLTALQVDPEVASILPEAMARRYSAICIGKVEKKITLAMVDPVDVFVLDDVRIRTGFDVNPVLAEKTAIENILNTIYGEDSSWKNLVDNAESAVVDVINDEDALEADGDVIIDQPIIRLVNMIISQAVERKASDIHIEPFEKEVLVRYRIDGILHEIMTVPKSLEPAVIARIKIMASLRIDEKRVPQDGRIHLKMMGGDFDFRVSTLPTVAGESVVMRILDKRSIMVELKDLGFSESDFKKWTTAITLTNGIILVTGPTGSGKSTTLYATLKMMNKPDVKILTVEDPVEYNLKGIIQVQTNHKVGLDFSRALRAFLRQDPDKIMVGEIRDKETGGIAIEAALTGHMVLSTLHTNSSVDTVTRLIEMGIEPFLVASTLVAILAQRLGRKICSKCKREIQKPKKLMEIFQKVGVDVNEVELYKGEGCNVCNQTGYKGRVGLYELLVASDAFKDLVNKEAHFGDLFNQARKDGMKTLYEDGLMKVAKGVTTYDELYRVTAD